MSARITVVETAYFQPGEGSQPSVTDSRYARAVLSDDEQPYVRRLKVGEDWKALDSGWIKEAGLLLLSNDEGQFMHVNPSAEDRKAALEKIVEMAFHHEEPAILVLPGESCRFSPSSLTLWLRCRKGTAACTLTLFPV